MYINYKSITLLSTTYLSYIMALSIIVGGICWGCLEDITDLQHRHNFRITRTTVLFIRHQEICNVYILFYLLFSE